VKVHKTTLSLKIFFHDAFSKRGFIVHCVDWPCGKWARNNIYQ
jgi:hypothetical protein